MGMGGLLAKRYLLIKFRTAGAGEAAASERMALAIARTVEMYGFLVAFVTGLILAITTGAFGTGGYLHAKTLLVVILMGLGHAITGKIKRMIALREAGQEQEIARLKQTHTLLSGIAVALIVVIVALVVMKPF